LHIEQKGTIRGSIAVRVEWLDRVTEEARARGRDPALILTFDRTGDVRFSAAAQHASHDWMLLPLEVAERLLEEKKKDGK
jgi:hypothetical protein